MEEMRKQIERQEKRISQLEDKAYSNLEAVKEKCRTVYFTAGLILTVLSGLTVYLSQVLKSL